MCKASCLRKVGLYPEIYSHFPLWSDRLPHHRARSSFITFWLKKFGDWVISIPM